MMCAFANCLNMAPFLYSNASSHSFQPLLRSEVLSCLFTPKNEILLDNRPFCERWIFTLERFPMEDNECAVPFMNHFPSINHFDIQLGSSRSQASCNILYSGPHIPCDFFQCLPEHSA